MGICILNNFFDYSSFHKILGYWRAPGNVCCVFSDFQVPPMLRGGWPAIAKTFYPLVSHSLLITLRFSFIYQIQQLCRRVAVYHKYRGLSAVCVWEFETIYTFPIFHTLSHNFNFAISLMDLILDTLLSSFVKKWTTLSPYINFPINASKLRVSRISFGQSQN